MRTLDPAPLHCGRVTCVSCFPLVDGHWGGQRWWAQKCLSLNSRGFIVMQAEPGKLFLCAWQYNAVSTSFCLGLESLKFLHKQRIVTLWLLFSEASWYNTVLSKGFCNCDFCRVKCRGETSVLLPFSCFWMAYIDWPSQCWIIIFFFLICFCFDWLEKVSKMQIKAELERILGGFGGKQLQTVEVQSIWR